MSSFPPLCFRWCSWSAQRFYHLPILSPKTLLAKLWRCWIKVPFTHSRLHSPVNYFVLLRLYGQQWLLSDLHWTHCKSLWNIRCLKCNLFCDRGRNRCADERGVFQGVLRDTAAVFLQQQGFHTTGGLHLSHGTLRAPQEVPGCSPAIRRGREIEWTMPPAQVHVWIQLFSQDLK